MELGLIRLMDESQQTDVFSADQAGSKKTVGFDKRNLC